MPHIKHTHLTIVLGLIIVAAIIGAFLLPAANDMQSTRRMNEMTSKPWAPPRSTSSVLSKTSNVPTEQPTQTQPTTRVAQPSSPPAPQSSTTPPPTPLPKIVPEGTYVTYDESVYQNAQNGPVVLFFAAEWCPSCRALDQDIASQLSSIPNGVTIAKIDYDNSTELKKKYGVTYTHRLVQVDANGNLIKMWTHSPNLEALLANI